MRFRSHLPDRLPAPRACCGSASRTLRHPRKPHRVTWVSRVPSILPARPLILFGRMFSQERQPAGGLACPLPESTSPVKLRGQPAPEVLSHHLPLAPSPMPSLGCSHPGIARTCLHGGSPSGEGSPIPAASRRPASPVNMAPLAGPCLLVLEATGLWEHRISRHRLGLAPPAWQPNPHDKEAKL